MEKIINEVGIDLKQLQQITTDCAIVVQERALPRPFGNIWPDLVDKKFNKKNNNTNITNIIIALAQELDAIDARMASSVRDYQFSFADKAIKLLNSALSSPLTLPANPSWFKKTSCTEKLLKCRDELLKSLDQRVLHKQKVQSATARFNNMK